MPALRIFCAYASQDRAYFEQLKQALAVPMRQQRIVVWHHGEITPGTEFDREIEKQFYQADIVLLLISPAFMASDYCSTREMQWALTRQKTGDAVIIPIIVKPTPDWEATFLGSLQVLPTGKKPITVWKRQDEAFADIVNELLRIIQEMQQEERFPVKEYRIIIFNSVMYYGSGGKVINTLDLESAWLKEAQCIETREVKFGTMYEKWLLSKGTQSCLIDFTHIWELLTGAISITSQHPMLINHLLQTLPLPYYQLQWTLFHDVDVDTVIQKIREQTGKFPDEGIFIDYDNSRHFDTSYTFSHPEGHGICVALQRDLQKYDPAAAVVQRESITGQASVISLKIYWDPVRAKAARQSNPAFQEMVGLYHAHQVFSPQKIMAMLNGKIPPKHIWQLIDESWKP